MCVWSLALTCSPVTILDSEEGGNESSKYLIPRVSSVAKDCVKESRLVGNAIAFAQNNISPHHRLTFSSSIIVVLMKPRLVSKSVNTSPNSFITESQICARKVDWERSAPITSLP